MNSFQTVCTRRFFTISGIDFVLVLVSTAESPSFRQKMSLTKSCKRCGWTGATVQPELYFLTELQQLNWEDALPNYNVCYNEFIQFHFSSSEKCYLGVSECTREPWERIHRMINSPFFLRVKRSDERSALKKKKVSLNEILLQNSLNV